jgi:hypothetical protein
MKMLQQVEVRSSSKCSTRLSSAVCVAILYDFAATLKACILVTRGIGITKEIGIQGFNANRAWKQKFFK